jgi:hypothetical protein
MVFNIALSHGSDGELTITIPGVTSKNVTGFTQAITTGAKTGLATIQPNSNIITVIYDTNDLSTRLSGDIALDSKPTFATKAAPDLYLSGAVNVNQVIARARITANQDIGTYAVYGTSGNTTILEDSHNAMDVNGGFTCPSTGYYLVSGSIRLEASTTFDGSTEDAYVYIQVDSSIPEGSGWGATVFPPNSATSDSVLSFAKLVPLLVGQKLELRVGHTTTVTETFKAASATGWEISKLPSPQDLANMIVGFNLATEDREGLVKKGVAVPDASGASPTKAEFDALLDSLRDAGMITP